MSDGIFEGAPGVLTKPHPDELYKAQIAAKDSCKRCHRPVFWCSTFPKGKPICLDYRPATTTGDGQFTLGVQRGRLLAVHVGIEDQRAGTIGHFAHRQTCKPRRVTGPPLNGRLDPDDLQRHLERTGAM